MPARGRQCESRAARYSRYRETLRRGAGDGNRCARTERGIRGDLAMPSLIEEVVKRLGDKIIFEVVAEAVGIVREDISKLDLNKSEVSEFVEASRSQQITQKKHPHQQVLVIVRQELTGLTDFWPLSSSHTYSDIRFRSRISISTSLPPLECKASRQKRRRQLHRSIEYLGICASVS